MLLKDVTVNNTGRFDFFYLPVDTGSKANVGYAFINFIDPVYIVPFFEEMNGKGWWFCNSTKICQITFGRV